MCQIINTKQRNIFFDKMIMKSGRLILRQVPVAIIIMSHPTYNKK